MKIVLENIGIFQKKELRIPDKKVVIIMEPSATGKTTLARVFYAFLTAKVDLSLLRRGASEGNAELFFGGKTYRLKITRNNFTVHRILEKSYGEYLVFTEDTPIYKIYASPPKQIDIEHLTKSFINIPPEIKQLENRLRQLTPNMFDIETIIEGYEEEIKRREKRVRELKKKLEEIDVEIKNSVPIEEADIVLKKREMEARIEDIKRKIEEAESEHAKLLSEIQGVNYEDIKMQRKKLADKIGYLRRELGMLESGIEGYRKIREGLDKLRSIIDILYDLNTPLFGHLISSDIVDTFIRDCDIAIQIISGKHAEIKSKIVELEKKKAELDEILTDYVRKHDRMSVLESEVRKLKKTLREMEYRVLSLTREVNKILKQLRLSEDELIERVMKQGRVAELVEKKKRIEGEIERLENEVRDIRRALMNAIRQRDQVLKKKKEYEELKKRLNKLKAEYNRKRVKFKEILMKGFKEVFDNVTIPDFDPENMKIHRSPYTYAQSERLLIAIAYQYALIKALKALDYKIPLVVIDLVVPLDSKIEQHLVELYRKLDVKTIIMKTSDVSSIRAV